jgi:hypothetical protein
LTAKFAHERSGRRVCRRVEDYLFYTTERGAPVLTF